MKNKEYANKEYANKDSVCNELYNELTEVKKERDLFLSVAKTVGVGIVIIDNNFKITWANNVIKNDFIGHDVIGEYCYEMYAREKSVCDGCGLSKILDGSIPVGSKERKGKDKDNNTIWSELIARPLTRNKKGEITSLVQVVIPITERKKSEFEKEEQSKNLKNTNKKLKDSEAVLIKAHQKLNKKQTELTEKNQQLKSNQEETQQLLEELSTTNEQLYHQKEELIETLNKLKKTQAQLIQSEKMASVGILSAGIAHEINNPLNFIHGSKIAIESYIIENLSEHESELSPLLDYIDTGIKRATQIVKSLNHFSRKNDTNNEKCNLHLIIDNCLVVLQNKLKNKIKVQKKYTDTKYIILGNESKLHQVFLNILINAIQAIKKKGTITITTKINTNQINIIIKDTGFGITKKNISKISDPFFTTKDSGKGTGLGLSIAFKIIKEHNGKIEYKSELNKGTSVIISFPIKHK